MLVHIAIGGLWVTQLIYKFKYIYLYTNLYEKTEYLT